MLRSHLRITQVSLLGYMIIVRERIAKPAMGPNHEITVALRAAIGEPDVNGVRLTFDNLRSVLDALPNLGSYEIHDGQGHGFTAMVWP